MNKLQRAWDSFDVYLFDIDGTLLHCSDAVHYFAFCTTLESICGKPMTLEGVTAHGNTDIGILRDALLRAGVASDAWRPRLPAIKEAMCRYVEDRFGEMCATALPHVEGVLRHLSRRGALLGVATGNLERIGKLKLRRAGLLEFFQFGAWSDAFEFRTEVIRAGVESARDLAGRNADICMIGDTPADVSAAQGNKLPVVAVATGIYTFEQLEQARPDLCVHSLGELQVEAEAVPDGSKSLEFVREKTSLGAKTCLRRGAFTARPKSGSFSAT